MPELPEVESIRNRLRLGSDSHPSLLGRLFQGIEILWSRSVAFPSPQEFQAQVVGQTVLELSRRGKYLIFHLSDSYLLVHLRMSGDLVISGQENPNRLHDRLIFHLDNGILLAFNDARKFGRVWLVNDPEQITGSLGPEPFSSELTGESFHQKLVSTRRQLKPLLMDQTFIAGLGNIYADESLHRAHLHPLLPSNQISQEQSSRLLGSIREVLDEGIRRCGASIDWVYRGGDFQNYFRVYKRTGEACLECGTPIVRIVVGQRGTHFCPVCQKLD